MRAATLTLPASPRAGQFRATYVHIPHPNCTVVHYRCVSDTLRCPAMPNAKVRTIHRAVQTLGGAKALADAFGVKPALVESWLAGTASPDSVTYLAALDIVARGSLGAAKGSQKK